MKDVIMIIQNTANLSQANQPDMRAHRAEPVKAVATSPTQNASPHPSVEALKSAVSTINKEMQQAHLNLQFSVDTDSNRTVVKMVDPSTGELIRQYPSKEILAISRSIDQFQQGLLLKQEA
ncbi:MAG: flagellar protein FlaG [Thiobacillus sp.]